MSEATRTVDGAVLPAVGTWSIDAVHSHIEFTVRHLVVGKTRGRFDTFSGTVEIAEDPTASSVTLEIDAASVEHQGREPRQPPPQRRLPRRRRRTRS